MRRIVSTLAIAGSLVAAVPLVAFAQGLPGLTIFSGVQPGKQLSYRLDFGGNSGSWDRYRFRIGRDKVKVAIAQFSIDYPNYFRGTFDPKNVELLVNDKKVAVQEVQWEKDNYVLQVFPQEPVPAGSNVELIFNNVRNPNSGGMFYFNCRILSPGDVPLLRDIGTWIVTIQ
ncbi:DUF2808 domain-containing protein [Leptolyngbya sp. NIES-2104]|uniref:DUF2808 domain-containing protein n=1 Tax=Leptolyngbya sp. NIES-2104 TaxID=1552121 RepID=UPI0006EC90B2|nr:DUF2808 domain-containing protein [Leptolyngbya sp. NIES-2104]GAP94993.1 hypothetical protein NIES2104_15120 [Leptolyngbya sp. NIES-2104]